MGDTQVTWVEGVQFVAESAGHSIVIDGAPGFGRNTGMPPMRLLLLGAAGCSAMDVVHIFKQGMRILLKLLKRRSQHCRLNWERFGGMLDRYKVERPRIVGRPKARVATRAA
jgi:hypothetical protein